MTRIDPDLLPQPLPEGWLPPKGRHLGAMVVSYEPATYAAGDTPWGHFLPTEWRLLTDAFCDAGEVEPGDVYFTSIVKVPGGDLEAAMPYLVEEVQNVVPRFVLALGQKAWQTLTGLELKLPLYRGIWHRLADPFDWDEGLVLGAWSPADVLADHTKVLTFQRDVGEFTTAWLGTLDGWEHTLDD